MNIQNTKNEVLIGESDSTAGLGCNHRWTKYWTGLSHTHDICVMCDTKREAQETHFDVSEERDRYRHILDQINKLPAMWDDEIGYGNLQQMVREALQPNVK